MSGANESPRQKLIGMMYLVLTALLALQVSSAIIDKFDFLNRSLELANGEAVASNDNMILSIKKSVEDDGGGKDDLKWLTKAEEVKKKTAEMYNELAKLKQQMIDISGGKDETGHYVGAKEETKIESLMIGGALKNGQGYAIQKRLNDMAEFLSDAAEKKGKDRLQPLAKDAKDIPSVASTDQKNKDFAELNFGQTPMVAALAVLSQKQSELTRYEAIALEHLASKVGATKIKFDVVEAKINPELKFVAAGTKYKAELFIAASSSSVTPEMRVNGSTIPVQNGKGQVEFPATASGGSYENGIMKKTFTAEIKMKTPGGKDTTFTNKIEYFVTEPVIQVQSASVSALYLNCGNDLSVQVPALGTNYNPTFTATGATVIPGSKKGFVTVVPNAKDVQLNVSSNGFMIGNQKFRVRGIPKPEIKAYQGSKEVNLKMGENASALRSLKIKAIPEEGFKTFLPNDARYKVAQWEISLARGSRPIKQLKLTDEEVNLSEFATLAKPGDRIVIEIKSVKRLNFRNVVEEVPMGSQILTIPLN